MVAASVQHLIDSLPKAELHVHIEGCIEVRSRSLSEVCSCDTTALRLRACTKVLHQYQRPLANMWGARLTPFALRPCLSASHRHQRRLLQLLGAARHEAGLC